MTDGKIKKRSNQKEMITDGIDIKSWRVPVENGDNLTFSIWDFAGQTVYYNTHQVKHR